MSDDRTANPPPMQPVILSMEVDDDDSFESEYRVRIGNQVKYLIISPRTFDRDTLSFPIQSLPCLPYNEEWTVAHISRDETSGNLKTSISNRALAGVKCQWHHTEVDCLELEKTKQLTAMAFEAVSLQFLQQRFVRRFTIGKVDEFYQSLVFYFQTQERTICNRIQVMKSNGPYGTK
ncbi:hypothetical protein HOO65_050482 [Ceratocystis lukuohia]|uniref:Uncharacterized protein n=1 Tax=Ceratocystis lukuohia TaxID=2019550 RepID=A0ABR4MGH9_9PEZI